jgi:hypothetical protein
MYVTECDTERVSRIFLRRARQREQRLDHMLHLRFGRSTCTDNCLLHLPGLVLKDGQPGIYPCDDGDTPGFTKLERGVGISGHEYAFNRKFHRLVLFDNPAKGSENLAKAVGEWRVAAKANAATCHIGVAGTRPRAGLDEAIPSDT